MNALQVLSLGKIIHLHFLTLPRWKWVPISLGKFPATDWHLVLWVVRAICDKRHRNWRLWPYGPYSKKRQTFYYELWVLYCQAAQICASKGGGGRNTTLHHLHLCMKIQFVNFRQDLYLILPLLLDNNPTSQSKEREREINLPVYEDQACQFRPRPSLYCRHPHISIFGMSRIFGTILTWNIQDLNHGFMI